MNRRLPFISFGLILTLTLTSVGLSAQGPRGGMGRGFGRGNPIGAPGQVAPGLGPRSGFVGRGPVTGIGPQFVFRPQVVRSHPQVLRTHPGFGYFQPFGGFTSPYYGWAQPIYATPAYVTPMYPSPAYVEPYPRQNEVDLSYQVQQLSREIEQLRQEQALAATLPPPPPAPPPAPLPEDTTPQPLTTLIFRDGRQLNIQNYAIVGQTLWVLDDQAIKIPLSELDLEATQQENRGQGVRFPLPR